MMALLALSIIQDNVRGQLAAINRANYAPSSAAAPLPRQTPAGVSVAPNHRQNLNSARILDIHYTFHPPPGVLNGPGEP